MPNLNQILLKEHTIVFGVKSTLCMATTYQLQQQHFQLYEVTLTALCNQYEMRVIALLP